LLGENRHKSNLIANENHILNKGVMPFCGSLIEPLIELIDP